ncbi:MAG: Cysteine desulfurase SufS [Patescibacteria group bacterium]|jgi:cysteine desulfurase/selenocysteine lyase|nr:Cysteine desulfurase SufS [Patescibacteria group bacterium]
MKTHREDFPLFKTYPDLVYLDNASTTQKPEVVIEAVSEFYRTSNANIHRGLYDLSIKATSLYEEARQTCADFFGAANSKEIIFTRGATEGINLLAASLSQKWQAGDEVILSELEHHANLVPWQQVATSKKIALKFAQVNEAGEIDLDHFESLLTEKTKLVSLSHCSNVLGTFLPSAEVKKRMDRQGSQALFLLDASQSAAHFQFTLSELGCDFLVCSGHKLYGPSGIGILWGRASLLSDLPPYQTGGDMIRTVSYQETTWNDIPWKFEAGTPNIEGAIGLAAALKYLQKHDMLWVEAHSEMLSNYAQKALKEIPEVKTLGKPHPASGIISFIVEGMHPHDVAELLNQRHICIRAGHHCAAPLHGKLGITASNRISFGLHNTEEDIDRFVEALKEIIQDFNHV